MSGILADCGLTCQYPVSSFFGEFYKRLSRRRTTRILKQMRWSDREWASAAKEYKFNAQIDSNFNEQQQTISRDFAEYTALSSHFL
jgi:hypothetical protein